MEHRHAIHEAFVEGDLEALRAALGDPPDLPTFRLPRSVGDGHILEFAMFQSPMPFIRQLLKEGADQEYPDDGFPSLIAALSSDRPDRYEIVELLLDYGAETRQRGVNDWTPLHDAAAADDVKAIELLLSHGADPTARTRIDEYATPCEEAEILGKVNAVDALRRATGC